MKRCAIIGTAQSWTQCPWNDASLEVWGLNDAYVLGIPRASRWYDIHPIHQMNFRPKGDRVVAPDQVPLGAYLRPADHLSWLQTRPMPVYLLEQRADFPTSQTFPKDEILAFFQPHWPYRLSRTGQIAAGKDYETSTPAWMLMHAIVEGYQEIHVYGIHLATEWEYVQQRPNFEWLLGFAAGRGIKIVLPQATPICRADFRYAYEPKADLPLQALSHQIAMVKHEGAAVKQRLEKLKWYEHATRKDLEARSVYLDVELADLRGQLAREQLKRAA